MKEKLCSRASCFVNTGIVTWGVSRNPRATSPKGNSHCSHTRRCRVYLSAEPLASASGVQALRQQLLQMVHSFGRLGGTDKSSIDDIEGALEALLRSHKVDGSSRLLANDLDPNDTAMWNSRLEGQWNLRYSTEGPLLQLMTNKALPFLSTGKVYQLFRGDGSLQVSYYGTVEKLILPL